MTVVLNPYTTGAFVTGPQHYGREELIGTLLRGGGRAYWLVGNRRSGRTSLLRQLEWLAERRGRLIPLYWDLQGCRTVHALGLRLAEAARDSMPRLEPFGVSSMLAEEEDALTLLTHLRRLVMRKGRELLLLCDEADALVEMARGEAEFMQRLHRELTLGTGVRAVVASTGQAYRLHDACADWNRIPFLNGFEMSTRLGALTPAAAKSLIQQAQSPRGRRVKASSAVVAAIRDATHCHPFLLQLLCSRLWSETSTLRMPDETDLRVDATLAGFFDHDWGQLAAVDRRIMLALSDAQRVEPAALQRRLNIDEVTVGVRLANLESQDFIRKLGGRFAAGNAFLERWLHADAARLANMPGQESQESAGRDPWARQSEQNLDALSEQLNARRARLVELENLRAREFVHSPPQILAEIAQLEIEIAALRSLVVRRASA
jgi:DNA-binding Lrp family transcriptional regulator